jgi:crotonobetainyl-CoA:carnitine CoA-transferase CaiB-like acyl-CoA transferase
VGEALKGIRVLECGSAVSAAFCARLLADFGAEVIKVEPPGGDALRNYGPFPGDQPQCAVCLPQRRQTERHVGEWKPRGPGGDGGAGRTG